MVQRCVSMITIEVTSTMTMKHTKNHLQNTQQSLTMKITIFLFPAIRTQNLTSIVFFIHSFIHSFTHSFIHTFINFTLEVPVSWNHSTFTVASYYTISHHYNSVCSEPRYVFYQHAFHILPFSHQHRQTTIAILNANFLAACNYVDPVCILHSCVIL
jgi:hypothetical protein